MIDPQLNNWWSGKRLTVIGYHDSSLHGAGISLPVILPALSGLGMIWFSTVYGEYNDNALLLGCDRNTASLFEWVKYEETSPVQAVYNNIFPDEYALTASIRSALGLRLEGNNYFIDQENKVACQVYIHDNCFFYVKPVTEALLGRLLSCTLEQHSFYLGQEVDWSGIFDTIAKQLLTLGRIEIQSDPERQWVWIPQLEKRRHPFWKRSRQGTVTVENGKARFRNAA